MSRPRDEKFPEVLSNVSEASRAVASDLHIFLSRPDAKDIVELWHSFFALSNREKDYAFAELLGMAKRLSAGGKP